MIDGELIDAIAECADALADLCEAKGLKHRKHSQHIAPARRRIKSVVTAFFERQRKAVLASVKPRIAAELTQYPPIREASQTGKTFAQSLIPSNLSPLTFAASSAETAEYNSAITDLIAAAADGMGASAAAGTDYAGEWLANNSLSKLTGGLNDTSIGRLQDALADAWDKGGDYNSMVSAITAAFDDFSSTRADLIAQTETADAYNAGRAEIANQLGYDEHAWETESGDPCPVCIANEDQGWIDVDQDFDSGDDAPTAHPGCLCVVNFRKSSEDDE